MRRQCGKVSAQGVEMLVMIEHVEDGAFAPQCCVTLHEAVGAFLQPRMLELHRCRARIRRVGHVDESRHLGDEDVGRAGLCQERGGGCSSRRGGRLRVAGEHENRDSGGADTAPEGTAISASASILRTGVSVTMTSGRYFVVAARASSPSGASITAKRAAASARPYAVRGIVIVSDEQHGKNSRAVERHGCSLGNSLEWLRRQREGIHLVECRPAESEVKKKESRFYRD